MLFLFINIVTINNSYSTIMGNVIEITHRLVNTINYRYDNLNRKISETNAEDDETKFTFFDEIFGNEIKQTRFDSDKELIVTKNQFDLAGRLTGITHTGDNRTIYANYDPNGNRQTAEIQGQNQTYKTGKYNRLLSDANYRYEYDREGNRISKTSIKDGSTTKYIWDNRNRLIKIETPTETIEYIYDYLNRLVKRTQNKNETHFVHDDWQIVLQFDNKNLTPTHRYLWGIKQDELLCDNDNWTLGDHLNTIRDIIKSDGTVADHLEYNSFGKLISVTKNIESISFAYTGKLTDKVSELQWNINRWYDSNVGRWMSEDPIGFRGKDQNLFRYVKNSAFINIDAQGLRSNPVSQFSCCKNFDVFYNLVHGITSSMWDITKASICRNYLLSDVWWNNVEVTAIAAVSATMLAAGQSLETKIVIPVLINPPYSIVTTTTVYIETTLGAVSAFVARSLGIGGALGYTLSVGYAGSICNSWVCVIPGGQPSCVCNAGNLWEYSWQCRCPWGQEIYKHNSIARYSSYPGYGTNVTYVGQHW
jgi:RHS repeat-associated protein